MSGAFAYIVYVAFFVTVVLTVEGLWLFVRSLSPHAREVNRRLALINERQDAKAGLSFLKERQGGVFSHEISRRAPWLAQMLWMSRSGITPARIVAISASLTLASMMMFSATGAPFLLVFVFGAALGVGGPLAVVALMAANRAKTFLEQFPGAVDLVARSLQAGHPVAVALGVVAQQAPDPIGTEFGIAIDEMSYGLDRDEALSNMVQRFPLAELHLFVAAIQITRESGGNLAEVFLKLADVIRAKATLRKKVSALTAEGRLSCIILAALPVALFTTLSILRPEFYGEVASDPWFIPMMSGPPIFLIMGVWMIWRMVNFKI